MNKIPVGQTIAFGYAFLIGRFPTVLRICWVPTLLVVAVEYLGRRYTGYYAEALSEGGSALIDILVVGGSMFVTLLSSAVMAVGITRAALGQEVGGGAFYLPLGRTEWRMLGANVRYILGILLLFILAGLFSAFALYAAGVDFTQPAEAQPAGWPVLLASLLALTALGYATVTAIRLAALLPAVVVTEDLGLERANTLTKGNVARILLVTLGLFLPMGLLMLVLEAGVVYAAFGDDGFVGGMESFYENLEPAAAAQPLLWALYGFVVNVAVMGIYPSAGAFAYSKIVGPNMPMRHGTVPESG